MNTSSPLDDSLDDALAELESAEDFLNFFAVPFERDVVQVNRLHILQRFHDYLAREPHGNTEGDEATRTAVYRRCLGLAYDDFVRSDALGERVFRVLRQAVAGQSGCGTGGCSGCRAG